LIERRWVCAARRAIISSSGWNSASSHGETVITGTGPSPRGQSRLCTMTWVQVVPHFGGVQTKMSPGRGSKRAQRRLSKRAVR
jgi:hypothetical protein